jgi:general secretion pathway protein D
VPLLTSDYTNTSSNDNIVRSYDYEETGIVLDITPQVTSSDLISLEIDQKVSEAVSNTITTAKDTPVIDIRKLETAMTIANGQTMVIGGMIQEKNTDRISSVPFVADIPFLRRLFGNTEQGISRTEMLVLITGYIINEKSPVEEMVRRYNNAVRTLSTFERKLEDEHARDVERLKQVKQEREALRCTAAKKSAAAPVKKMDAPEAQARPAETGK